MRFTYSILLIFFFYHVLTNECGYFFIEMGDNDNSNQTYSFNILETVCVENGIDFYAIANDLTAYPKIFFYHLKKKGVKFTRK